MLCKSATCFTDPMFTQACEEVNVIAEKLLAMEDDAPLAVPLFQTETSPEPEAKQGVNVEGAADGDLAVDGVPDGHAEAVGITMITGYLGAGKTTVSEITKLIDDLMHL